MVKTNQRKLITAALLTAISFLLIMVIRVPFPPAPFLVFDLGDLPLILASFILGPAYALMATIVVSLLQGFMLSADGLVGAVMHILSSGCFVVIAGLFYKKTKSDKGAIIGLVIGTIALVIVMIGCNLVITVNLYDVPFDTVVAMLPTAIIPFNLIKGVLASTLSFAVFKGLPKSIKNSLS